MSQKTTVELIDDLDGSQAAETVRFGLDGRLYEADLSEKNAAKLRRSLEAFVASARRTGGRSLQKRSQTGSEPATEERMAMRQWARENGYEIGDRGRISQEIQDAFTGR